MFLKKVWHKTTGLASAVLDLFYPRHCYHCESPLNHSGNRLLCSCCADLLEKSRIIHPLCSVCGTPLPAQEERDTPLCLNCMARPPHFTRARSLFEYTGPAAEIIKSFKFRGEYFAGPELLRMAIKEGWLNWKLEKTHTIVPVPLHRKRERQRGYNQASMLARILAKHYAFPCSTKILKRQKNTRQQATLSAPQRWKNVRGAFAANPKRLPDRHILLIDDVMTTGATANECARLLKRNGAEEIRVFTLVRSKS